VHISTFTAGTFMQACFKPALTLATAAVMAFASLSALADPTSSASSLASQSVGSSSTSVEKSSDSSSGGKKVAQGQYQVIDVAALADQPDMMRVHLQAATPGATQEVFLLVPRLAAERGQLVVGQLIEAQDKPYGLAFVTVHNAIAATPFFLVLDDQWHRELNSRPVVL
jgi:hypothetical protein